MKMKTFGIMLAAAALTLGAPTVTRTKVAKAIHVICCGDPPPGCPPICSKPPKS